MATGFRAALHSTAFSSDLKKAAALITLLVCVVGFLFLIGKGLEGVSTG